MNAKAWIPLGLALVLGLAAAFLAKGMLTGEKPLTPRSDQTKNVIAASETLEPGMQITDAHLTSVVLAGDQVPEGSFATPESLVGRMVNMTMVKGQPVLESFLTPQGSGAGLQALIPPGMRAITVEVNEFSGVAGLLSPGCRVDIVSTFNDAGISMAKIIVQNVKVTAVGQRTGVQKGEDEAMARSVTLLVTPKQAEEVELAAYASRPRLVLRSFNDQDPAETSGVTVAELKGTSRNPVLPVPVSNEDPFESTPKQISDATTQPAEKSSPVATRQRTVTIIRGGSETTVTFEVPAPLDAVMTGEAMEP